ncbi:TadE/TadG family type IV pilus assembly protein [Paraburkholderia acidipaludis]|uniref:TadE/TadG family type IV pilus assembly protein n=1 Tax=Paraburkholderia acidipaludis TaxID=660537 RepID=UPI00047F7D7D|nr:TadE family protein [Paraburkholderia acidipaludis]
MSRVTGKPMRRTTQRGTAAVEFAIVFPVFFLVLYAIITYSMVFLTQQSLTAAAEEGARAALVWQSATSDELALNARATQACTRAATVVSWLPVAAHCTPAISSAPSGCTNNPAMDCIQVTLTYAYETNPLVPILPLLSIAIPQSLTGQATVQIDPENLL